MAVVKVLIFVVIASAVAAAEVSVIAATAVIILAVLVAVGADDGRGRERAALHTAHANQLLKHVHLVLMQLAKLDRDVVACLDHSCNVFVHVGKGACFVAWR